MAFQVGKLNDERPMGRNENSIFQEIRWTLIFLERGFLLRTNNVRWLGKLNELKFRRALNDS